VSFTVTPVSASVSVALAEEVELDTLEEELNEEELELVENENEKVLDVDELEPDRELELELKLVETEDTLLLEPVFVPVLLLSRAAGSRTIISSQPFSRLPSRNTLAPKSIRAFCRSLRDGRGSLFKRFSSRFGESSLAG
jgi:hypothetical protein